MEALTLTYDLAISGENYSEKAWHLVAVLLSFGRPASPAELAGKCTLFRSSPELVEFLCFVPKSPLYLTRKGLVFPSIEVAVAFGCFFADSSPRDRVGLFGAAAMFRRGGCRGGSGDFAMKYYRKRKVGSEMVSISKKRAVIRSLEGNDEEMVSFGSTNKKTFDLNALQFDIPMETVYWRNVSDMDVTSLPTFSSVGLLEHQLENAEDKRNGHKRNTSQVNDVNGVVVLEGHQDESFNNNESILGIADFKGGGCTDQLRQFLEEISAILVGNDPDFGNMTNIDNGAPSCSEHVQNNIITSVEAENAFNAYKALIDRQAVETTLGNMGERLLADYDFAEAEQNADKLSFGSNGMVVPVGDKLCPTITPSSVGKASALQTEVQKDEARVQPLVSADLEGTQEPLVKFPATVQNAPLQELTQKQPMTSKFQQDNKVNIIHKEQRGKKVQNNNVMKDRSKLIYRYKATVQEMGIQESSKDLVKPEYPEFESYVVEEEEGSGGYGTVYRARRKSDGVTFAIKYPHANAHKQHIKNELRMLERFGGKNFVIKYEGSFKSGNADCFVLEHVEHDRPEILKRDIDIQQLQWYGFCMFKALASLHKQGVFHRDVKPGNFLFSCKSSKGYLIDFNLAKDLHQKQGNSDKSQPSTTVTKNHIPAPQAKSVSPNKRRKILGGTAALKAGATGSTSHTLERKSFSKKALDRLKVYDDFGRRNSMNSQGADGSGLTSKDITSTRTPSADRLREPLPSQGRKELINLAQAAMQGPNLGAPSGQAFKRKRIAASPVLMDRKHIYLTPTPLHSSGIAISGAGSLKNRGDNKPHRDGPCVGTKGFRAPEVLLRSLHQGPKIDVWSAGVTLLYLITGKMPFAGDPEQNMKDIVKLKGNEELWEVAKLHNRESSFAEELLDIRYLPSMTIKDWCMVNTKRKDFLEEIPASLFDLIEKCLTVNPRLRITAEEALRHEFFAICQDSMRAQKLRRVHQSQASRSNSLSLLSKPVGSPYKELINPV